MSEAPQGSDKAFSPQAIHLVRTITQTNLTLSQMADQKASLLMGAAIVVFTLAMGQASSGDPAPAMVALGVSAFVSACLAIVAVLPTAGAKPVADDQPNVLFFGVFTQMEEEQFAKSVVSKLSDEEAMYHLMLRDIYQNGQVLHRKKYRLLGWSSRVFLAGLAASLATFVMSAF